MHEKGNVMSDNRKGGPRGEEEVGGGEPMLVSSDSDFLHQDHHPVVASSKQSQLACLESS